ncbi:hypothetical protein NPIL_126911 [Nephila pilipes]|uniref:Uncharacterized protein n=1 Tax=Nephila pilipes TaxID=299642 RepID=A0A8X6MKH2_NEPPI|nr:hypothetical protein NPIL_126911 [Nephila pilipes]
MRTMIIGIDSPEQRYREMVAALRRKVGFDSTAQFCRNDPISYIVDKKKIEGNPNKSASDKKIVAGDRRSDYSSS